MQPVDTIHVYELPCPSTEIDDPNWVIFPVYCCTELGMHRQVTLSPISQFGDPIVIAIEAEKLNSKGYLYNAIASHIERYCIVKLFEEDASVPEITEATVPTTDETDSHFFQQPIHTTAAVTPAGGRPMVPMPHLFDIHVFDCIHPLQTIQGNVGLTFPFGESTVDWQKVDHGQDNQTTLVKQGQGVIIEWKLNKAQQIFGSTNSSPNEVNADAWFDYDTITTKKSRKSSPVGVASLEDCLNEFTGDEQLSNDDSWYCPRCKQHQRASKKIDIWKLPEIMVVHLKRFSQARRSGSKIDKFIDFPLTELDMTDRVLGHSDQEPRLIYDLYAVDNHYGTLSAGHCKYQKKKCSVHTL
jgi:hypothetical protein